MWRHIDRLRGRPHHERKRVALLTSGGVTAVIALAWLSTFSISPVVPVGFASNQQAAVAESISPFALLKDSFVAAIGSAQNKLEEEAGKRSPANSQNPAVAATSTLLTPAGPEDRPF